jgi:hypothetical protein
MPLSGKIPLQNPLESVLVLGDPSDRPPSKVVTKRYVELVCCEAIDERIEFLDMRETVREFAKL